MRSTNAPAETASSSAKPENFLYRNGGIIETQGGFFNLGEPVFDIKVIAHALGNTCRFNGHCSSFYSVAEHSVLVSRLMSVLHLGDPLEGLLHDATEAYLSDVPSPFKEYLPDWRKVDETLDVKLREHFKLGPKTTGLKRADWIALFVEAHQLLPSRGTGEAWIDPTGVRPLAVQLCHEGVGVQMLSPKEAAAEFLKRYAELMEKSP